MNKLMNNFENIYFVAEKCESELAKRYRPN